METSGREVSIDIFHKIAKQFFKKMGKCLDVLEKLMDLNELLSLYKGCVCVLLFMLLLTFSRYLFDSASLFFVFDEDKESTVPPSVHLIDFERVTKTDTAEPDVAVITSIKHVIYEIRLAWEAVRPPTIYIVRHGERYDYTDIEWAPNAAHPHDSPLSKAGEAQAR
jgi:hypothetical protein